METFLEIVASRCHLTHRHPKQREKELADSIAAKLSLFTQLEKTLLRVREIKPLTIEEGLEINKFIDQLRIQNLCQQTSVQEALLDILEKCIEALKDDTSDEKVKHKYIQNLTLQMKSLRDQLGRYMARIVVKLLPYVQNMKNEGLLYLLSDSYFAGDGLGHASFMTATKNW